MAILGIQPNPEITKLSVKKSGGGGSGNSLEIGLKTLSNFKINCDCSPDHYYEGTFQNGDIVEILYSGNDIVTKVNEAEVLRSVCTYTEPVYLCINGYSGSVIEYLPIN